MWGPCLWNLFFKDERRAIHSKGFAEVVYAYDLNAFKAFHKNTPNDELLVEATDCQTQLHHWGDVNSVTFDADKESKHVLSRRDPTGGNFKLLGIDFDCQLRMDSCVHTLVTDCTWKLRTILRGQRFYNAAEMIDLYKAHVFSFIE